MSKLFFLLFPIFIFFLSCDEKVERVVNENLDFNSTYLDSVLHLGSHHIRGENFQDAYIFYKDALEQFDRPYANTKYIDAINGLCKASLMLDSLEDVSQYLKLADLTFKKGFNYYEGRSQSLYLESHLLFIFNDYVHAEEKANESLKYLRRSSNISFKSIFEIKIFLLLSDIITVSDNLRAEKYSNLALSKCKMLEVDSITKHTLLASSLIKNSRDILWAGVTIEQITKAYDETEEAIMEAERIVNKHSLENKIVATELFNLLSLVYHYKYKFYIPFLNNAEKENICKNKSVSYSKKSILVLSEKFGSLNLRLAESLNNLAVESNTEDAINLFNQAIQIYIKRLGRKNDKVGLFYNNIGRTYAVNGEYDSSLKYFQKSIMALALDFNNEDIFSNPKIDNNLNDIFVLEILEQKAFVLRRLYSKTNDLKYLKASNRTFKIAADLLNSIRGKNNFNESKEFIQAGYYRIFDYTISTYIDLFEITFNPKYIEKAYKSVQTSKANILQEKISQDSIFEFSRIPNKILIKEKNLRARINILKEGKQKINLLDHINYDDSKFIELNDSLLLLERELDELKTNISNNYSDHNKLLGKVILPLQELQKYIKDDRVVLEYFSSLKGQVHAFAITNDTILYNKIETGEKYLDEIKNIREQLSNSSSDMDKFVNSSSYLYDLLIRPFNNEIKDKSLLIIPHKELNTFPFDVLLANNVNTGNWSTLNYLIKDNPIQYLYSSNFIKNKSKRDSLSTIKAFAPFVNIGAKMDTLIKDKSRNFEFGTIQSTKKEIIELQRFYRSDTYTNKDATKRKFLNNLEEGNSIIHLATHGVVDDIDPKKSFLVFYPDSLEQDFILSVNEIYSFDLNTPLTFLSACSSGKGKVLEGEGNISLARAFTYGGSSSVIMSLWDINDYSTSQVVGHFYHELSKGNRKDTSLQKAKLKYLDDILNNDGAFHPYFWSALISIGDSSSI